MEPFDITFREVTSLEEDPDVFGNVVNYDLSFSQSDQTLPLSSYNVNTIQYTWKDVAPPTTTGIQTTNGGVPTGRGDSVQHLSVWHDGVRSNAPHLTFLVHPDDYLGQSQDATSKSPAVSQEDLKTLAQVNSNTAALSRQSRREGHKILVARTRTSPSTPIPPPSKSGMAQSNPARPLTSTGQDVPSSGVVGIDTISYISAAADDSDGKVEDNSFETVAEALKLQWSVIGNKTLAPAPPDVVAQIVAEAERKLKAGGASPLPEMAVTPRDSPVPIGLVETRTPSSPAVQSSPAVMLPPSSSENQPRQMTRIIPTDITVEQAHSGPMPNQSLHLAATPSTHSPDNFSVNNNQVTPELVNSILGQSALLNSLPNLNTEPLQITTTFSTSPVVANFVECVIDQASVSKHPTAQVTDTSTSTPKTPKPSSSSSQVDILDTISEASYSSEVELEKYSTPSSILPPNLNNLNGGYELESEEFLRSLPPIKAINLEDYTTPPVVLPPYVSNTENRSLQNQTANHTASLPHTNAALVGRNSIMSTSSVQNQDVNPRENHLVKSSLQNSDSAFTRATATPAFESPASARPQHAKSPTTTASLHGNNVTTPLSGTVDKKRYEKILKEKAKLQGQLEVLTSESHAMLQERAGLQSQLSTLQAKLSASSAGDDTAGLDAKSLHKEVLGLRESRLLLEQTILDANRLLSEKAEELRTIQDELQSVQEHTTKFQVRVQELKDEVRAKDMNTQALKNKIAELYVEVQTSIQAKMEAETESRTARNDLTTLVKAKEWYQEQLQLAHDVRSKLQREITVLQAQAVSHGAIVERLKTESSRLRQQLSDVQQKALHDKEALARHLETIQNDMMEREAAFLEIQRERKLYEDTFNSQVVTVEEEKSRLASLQQATAELEGQLDRAHGEAKKRHQQLLSVENGQMEAMKKLTLAGETLSEKDKLMEDMEQKLIQMENQLQAMTSDLSKKDTEILSLKEERASTEIALKSALQEKSSVDKALEVLKADMGKVEQSFKQMKQELSNRLNELEVTRREKEKLQEELDRSQHELDIKCRSVDSLTRTFDGQNAAQKELASEKGRLNEEKEELSRKVRQLELALAEKDKSMLEESEKVQALTATIASLESEIAVSRNSVPADKIEAYEAEIDSLRSKIGDLEQRVSDGASEVEDERDRLKQEMERLKAELVERQRHYENNFALMDSKLKEVSTEKQQIETELGITKRSQEMSEKEEQQAFTQEIQGLTLQLSQEKSEKQELEDQLRALQVTKASEIETLRANLESQTEALQALQAQASLLSESEETNEKLVLELEKEKGKVLGLSQKNQELKGHSHQLEGALAQRESCLEELRRTVEESQLSLEERESKFKTRISSLEAAVEKEVSVQKDIRKQMGVKIMENKRLKKHQESVKVETEQLKQDLATSQQVAAQATSDLELANQKTQALQKEVMEKASASRTMEAELERVKRELAENIARYPVLQEQIQSLEWQCSQKTRELESATQQIKMVEVRGQEEVEAVKASLSEKLNEIDALQTELSALRQEKTQQRSQVTELRGALKASVQHHKLTQRLNDTDFTDKATQANLDKKVVIPPLPFELGAIEKLLQDTRVTPLESKPLDQLSSCLTSLRAEITGLQKHMDLHTTAVTTSSQSAKNIESSVNDLNEVMRTIANTIIAANSTKTITMATAMDREPGEIINV